MNDDDDLEFGARLFIGVCLAGVVILFFLFAYFAGAFS